MEGAQKLLIRFERFKWTEFRKILSEECMEPLEEIECLKICPINFVKHAKFLEFFFEKWFRKTSNLIMLTMLEANIVKSGCSENLGSPL